MRGLIALALLSFACGPRLPPPAVPVPEIELSLDEGRASERPLTPPPTFEMLMRFDPKLAGYRLLRLRALLAQPGRVVYTVYASDELGRPGLPVKTLDRDYAASMISDGSDGKWIVEDLSDAPVQHGPVWIGLSCPEKNSDPRFWASSNDSGHVFQRDADPSLPLEQMRIARTPKLRLSITPAE